MICIIQMYIKKYQLQYLKCFIIKLLQMTDLLYSKYLIIKNNNIYVANFPKLIISLLKFAQHIQSTYLLYYYKFDTLYLITHQYR